MEGNTASGDAVPPVTRLACRAVVGRRQVTPKRAKADQLRKGVWLHRSFTLSTLNYQTHRSLVRRRINYSHPLSGFSFEKISTRLLR